MRKCKVCGSEENIAIYKGEYYCKRHYLQMYRHRKTFRTTHDPNIFEIYCDECHIVLFDKNCMIKNIAIVDKDDYNVVKDAKWYLTPAGYVASK